MSDKTNLIQDPLSRNRNDYQYCEPAYEHKSEKFLFIEDFRAQEHCKIYQLFTFLHDLQKLYELLFVVKEHLSCSQSVSLTLQFQLVQAYELEDREREKKYSLSALAFNAVKLVFYLVRV